VRAPATAGLVVLLAVLSPAPAGSQGLSPAYETVVGRYVAGDRAGAVAELGTWSEERLREETVALDALCRTAQACSLCPAAAEWRRIARAALMLQSDCAQQARRGGKPAHAMESATADIARMLATDPTLRAFAARWYEATAGLAQGENRWDEALGWAEAGVRAFPQSPELLLAHGSIEETVAVQAALPSTEPALVADSSQRRANRQRQQDALFQLERARDAFLAAIAAAPGLPEARLRLGRVEWRLGRAPEARAALEGLLSTQRAGPTAFLGHLFLGRVHEEAGRQDEALACYESALALHPRAQSALVARSHLRLRRGDAAGARRDAETAVAAGGHRLTEDPYWLYPWGAAVGAEERLEALRREASP
jgi:tetratricopeptide (TPR) repeat protein